MAKKNKLTKLSNTPVYIKWAQEHALPDLHLLVYGTPAPKPREEITTRNPNNTLGYEERTNPQTFAGELVRFAGGSEEAQNKADNISAGVSLVPLVGLYVTAMDLGMNLNRTMHNPSKENFKNLGLDAASMLRAKVPKRFDLYKTSSNVDRFLHKAGRKIGRFIEDTFGAKNVTRFGTVMSGVDAVNDSHDLKKNGGKLIPKGSKGLNIAKLLKDAPWGRLPLNEGFYFSSKFNPSASLILKGSKVKTSRVLKDAGYLEMVLKRLGISRDEAKKLVQALLDAIDHSQLGNQLEGAPINGVYAQAYSKVNHPSFEQILGGFYKLKKGDPQFKAVMDENMLFLISLHPELLKQYPGTHWFERGSHEIGHLSTASKENSANLYFKLIGENNKSLANRAKNIIIDNYGMNPWEIRVPETSKYKGTKVIKYLTDPDELRVRALKLERLRQTTGKSYEELLNDESYLLNPDIKQLKDLYDKANYGENQNAIMDFLTQYVKEGGKFK